MSIERWEIASSSEIHFTVRHLLISEGARPVQPLERDGAGSGRRLGSRYGGRRDRRIEHRHRHT